MTDEEKIAYEEGRVAATNAEPEARCPYGPDDAGRAAAWRAGYEYVEAIGRKGEPND
ncbi:hypothetical protein [Aureimonas leprariae]|uniref:hypothetical protein n=1 Tax=Plantimonas leprariae TaxID=2615207 RepID=UPI001387019B|nr:hypothetical protein [Aureimonas leprariae]